MDFFCVIQKKNVPLHPNMKKTLLILFLSLLAGAFVTLEAKPKKAQRPKKDKVFLVCHALTTTYDYTQLRSAIASDLTNAGYTLVRSAQEADWTVQVTGTVGATLKTDFGAASFYTADVTAVIIIDRGAYQERVYETALTQKGKNPIGFDEAVVEAYGSLTPKICETILEKIR